MADREPVRVSKKIERGMDRYERVYSEARCARPNPGEETGIEIKRPSASYAVTKRHRAYVQDGA
jgi:hypothetical protein